MVCQHRSAVSHLKRCRALAFCFLTFACSPPVLADGAEGSVADEVSPEMAEALARVEQLSAAVDDLAQLGNGWRPEIAETLLSLGRALQTTNDHDAALATLERSVHVSRINHGLFSLEQLPALQLQVESHLALGQWDEADGLRQYAFYVQSRAYGDNDPGMIPALVEYASWHMDAFADRRGEVPVVRLIDAYQLYSVALSIIDRQENPLQYPKVEYLQQLAFVSWLLHRTQALAGSNMVFSEERQVDDTWVDTLTEQKYRNRNSAFLRGEFALQEIVSIHELHVTEAAQDVAMHSDLLHQHVQALLDLADWNLLFERRQAANTIYRQAWDLLADEGPEVRKSVFDKVVLLPSFEPRIGPQQERGSPSTPERASAFAPSAGSAGAPVRNHFRDQSPDGYDYVIMEFDINRYGRATNVNLIDKVPPHDDALKRRMVGALRDAKLRPRILDGEPVQVTGLLYRFPYEIETQTAVTQ